MADSRNNFYGKIPGASGDRMIRGMCSALLVGFAIPPLVVGARFGLPPVVFLSFLGLALAVRLGEMR